MATSKTLAPTNVTISIPAMTDQPNTSVLANCADKEADAINALNSQFVDIFINKGLMADNANFNDFVTSGTWKNSGTNTGQTNTPSSADNGYLIVAGWQNGQRASQIWISAYTGSHKKRNYNGTSWTAWTDL